MAVTLGYRFLGLLDPLPTFSATAYKSTTDLLVFGPVGPSEPLMLGHFTETSSQRVSRKFGNDFNHIILVGLRYAPFTPRPPAPPLAAPVPLGAPEVEAGRTYLVFFGWDHADLTERARQIIAEAAQASTRVQVTRIEVDGYTDLSGTAAYNLRLSARRAKSVTAELVRNGVGRGEIGIHGRGENDPMVATAQGVREPQNRRVEILLR